MGTIFVLAIRVVLPQKVKQVSNLKNSKHKKLIAAAPQIVVEDIESKAQRDSLDTIGSITRKSTASVDDIVDQSESATTANLLKPAQSTDSVASFSSVGSMDNLIESRSRNVSAAMAATPTPPNKPGIITIRRNTEDAGTNAGDKMRGNRKKRDSSLGGFVKFRVSNFVGVFINSCRQPLKG